MNETTEDVRQLVERIKQLDSEIARLVVRRQELRKQGTALVSRYHPGDIIDCQFGASYGKTKRYVVVALSSGYHAAIGAFSKEPPAMLRPILKNGTLGMVRHANHGLVGATVVGRWKEAPAQSAGGEACDD